MRSREAKQILDQSCMSATGKTASSKQVTKDRNDDGRDVDWWLENLDTLDSWDGPRSRAYLSAYNVIAGERFFVTGIPLRDGYLQPDRAVMKRLLEANAVVIENGRFVLTELGESILLDD